MNSDCSIEGSTRPQTYFANALLLDANANRKLGVKKSTSLDLESRFVNLENLELLATLITNESCASLMIQ